MQMVHPLLIVYLRRKQYKSDTQIIDFFSMTLMCRLLFDSTRLNNKTIRANRKLFLCYVNGDTTYSIYSSFLQGNFFLFLIKFLVSLILIQYVMGYRTHF